MLIFDQLKKNDPQLRLLALVVAGGLFLLLAGLWWMQIASAKDYRANLETQSFRTVRIPAVRGKIFDRNGQTLAENRPSYNISLYLEELRRQFKSASDAETRRVRNQLTQERQSQEKKLGRPLNAQEKKPFFLGDTRLNAIYRQARFEVASNVVQEISRRLQYPFAFEFTNFQDHCQKRLALPYPVARNIDPLQVARFEEQFADASGLDLEVQSTRVYPNGSLAAHLLGYLRYDDSSTEGEAAYFYYRLPDFSGVLGIESAYEKALHGHAGAKSVLVNNQGYRQTEDVWPPAEPGSNVVLTIDLHIQEGTERALLNAPIPSPRGAAVVMDVNTGDVLALASVPSFNPNYFVDRRSFPPDYYEHIQAQGAEHNRATAENYRPGSIFKTVVALACLEKGLDPKAVYEVQADPDDPRHGCIYVTPGNKRTKKLDTAEPGSYDFDRALMQSSNAYFITNGIHVAGIEKIVELGRQLHLGERFTERFDDQTGKRVGLGTKQETAGGFPSLQQIHAGWSDGDTANLCIGQGFIDVTPLQMAVLASALANGGKVLWPRFVDRIESQDPLSTDAPVVFAKGRVRDRLGVKPRSLQIVRDAMLKDVESAAGTGTRAFIKGFRICAKTGTAQNERNGRIDKTIATTWCLTFAPYENPRYAVVVMLESGVSGGVTCAPVVRQIYESILQSERINAARTGALARTN